MATAKMNAILGKLSKGVGSSKILPITEYLKMELVEGTLTIVATDSANFIEHTEKGVEGEDGTAIVQADKLIKLISKTTKQQVTVELKETHLAVKGNGDYKVELFDTNEYPTYDFNTEIQGIAVKTAVLKKAFSINKSAIATETLVPALTAYNIGSDVLTTDGVKVCINETAILQGQRALIPQKLADLLQSISTEEVYIQKEGNKLLFTTESTTIFGTELDGIEDYPDVAPLTGLEYSNIAKVKRKQLLEAFDRISLFVDNTTNYGVKLRFATDALYIEDLKGKSFEKVEYTEPSASTEEINILFNLGYITDIATALSKDDLSIYYENELPLKIKEVENITFILSTMSPE